MIKSYLKIAWRNIIKSKGYSAINIGGLAVGMAVAILIGLWLYDELSFNKYHKNYDDIAQVMRRMSFNGENATSITLQRPLEKELRNKYGNQFKHIVMSRWTEGHILSVADKKISKAGRFMQEGAPDMLSLHMLGGTLQGLKDPSSIMLSASTATALFGNADPMDKMLRIDNKMDVKVTGVYEDIPVNTSFSGMQFISTWDLMLTQNKWLQDVEDKWYNSSVMMYVQVQPGTTPEAVSAIIKNAIMNVAPEDTRRFNQQPFLQPMSKWHLYSEFKNGVNVGGRIQYVWLFGIIGVFVLLLACINFMNLSTARSEKRAKEVGIRKAIGSMRRQLIRQFLSESLLTVFLAFLLSIGIVALSLSLFNELAAKQMSIPWGKPVFWLICLGFILITGLVSGSYPALYLSSFNPIKVLKGTFRAGRYAGLPRKVLVVVQYTVSITLIIGTIIVYKQIQYAKDRPVGYSRDGLMMMQIKAKDLREKYEALRAELQSAGIVSSMALSSSPVTAVWDNDGGLEWKGKGSEKVEGFAVVRTSFDYGKTVGWEFKEGRDFSAAFPTDSIRRNVDSSISRNLIINEAAAAYMGFKHPLGETIRWNGLQYKVIGVIKNMIVESPFNPVKQGIYTVDYDAAGGYINMRINPSVSMSSALKKIEAVIKVMVPAVPFDYQFADTEYAEKFTAEERVGKLASVFAFLAVLISCLGLFGLAAFVAEKRTKEIGVRKVLGASVFNLWKMLSKDFLLLVMISCLIAIPIAWYYLHSWLQDYEYRTTISWWIFVVAMAGAILVTILTVSFQAIKAAVANPVKSLRTE
jgi:ABC-type antimicrobial peptide transport system permease subunit